MRKTLLFCLSLVLVLALPLPAAAQVGMKVVGCEDDDNPDATFRDRCPAGVKTVREHSIRVIRMPDPPAIDEIAAANPITLYTVPQCDACDLVRNMLTTNGLPFSEKDVQDNGEMQEELRAASGGLTVPATVIGTTVSTGYSRSALEAALVQAGYPIEPQ